MDVEKMKRINALARELKDHGIVSDFDEAYKQAEKMIEGGLIERPVAEAQVSEVRQDNTLKPSIGLGVDALDIKNISERMKNLENHVGQVFVKINEIITEINLIEKKKRDSPMVTHQEPHKEQQAHLKDEKVQPHPRTGDFKPGDVAIEKMFYFGGGGRG